jgi:hypothetical protein
MTFKTFTLVASYLFFVPGFEYFLLPQRRPTG